MTTAKKAGAPEFPEGSGISKKTHLHASLYVQNMIFDGELRGCHFVHEWEEDPAISVCLFEFDDHSALLVHTQNGVIQFWRATNVDFEYSGTDLIVRPRKLNERIHAPKASRGKRDTAPAVAGG